MAPPPEGDNIDGVPGMMMDVQNSQMDLFDPAADLQPGMPEGQEFVTRDGPASQRLKTFVETANFGLESYSRTARQSGHTYMDSDAAAEATITAVVHDVYA